MNSSQPDVSAVRRRDFLCSTGMAVLGAALGRAPFAAEAADPKPRYGGRLRASERFNSPGLDAHRNQDFPDTQNYSLMYSGLFEMGAMPEVEMHPMLAKSWEVSRDGREYIFALREGVTFHHGKELDSGDVKYSMERVMNPATRAPRAFALRWIDSIQAADKYHIKIRLKEPYAPFLTALTIQTCAIIPAGWEPTGVKPAPGTGPFVLKSFVPNEVTEFTRFDRYWEHDEKTGDRLPYLDGIHLRKIVDATVRWSALRAGDLDYIALPPLNVIAKAMLEKKPVPGIVMEYDLAGNNWFWFNVSKPPFDKKKVRQAVAYGLDKVELGKAMYWGLGEPLNNQPFHRSRFYIPVNDREPDRAKARQLLADAGYPNGFRCEIVTDSVANDVAGTEAAIGQLKQIGIEGTMKVMDRVPFATVMRKGDYVLSFRGDSARQDWDDAYFMYFHSSELEKNNWARYSNKDLDRLLEKGRATVAWDERAAIYRQVVDILMEDLPILYISKTPVGVAFREHVKGYRRGFAVRFAWRGGGLKYLWLDK